MAMKMNGAGTSAVSNASGAGALVKKPDGPRKWIPRIANLLLWFLFCAMSGTGLLLAYRLPPGSRGGHGLSALGWTRHDWGDLHLWISFAFLAVVVLHMILHWRWFWQIAAKRRSWPLLVGLLAGLALLATLALLPVKRADNEKGDEQHARQAGQPGQGSGHGEHKRYRGGRE